MHETIFCSGWNACRKFARVKAGGGSSASSAVFSPASSSFASTGGSCDDATRSKRPIYLRFRLFVTRDFPTWRIFQTNTSISLFDFLLACAVESAMRSRLSSSKSKASAAASAAFSGGPSCNQAVLEHKRVWNSISMVLTCVYSSIMTLSMANMKIACFTARLDGWTGCFQ